MTMYTGVYFFLGNNVQFSILTQSGVLEKRVYITHMNKIL